MVNVVPWSLIKTLMNLASEAFRLMYQVIEF